MASTFFSLWAFAITLFSIVQNTSAQSLSGLCPGSNGAQYTDTNGIVYTIHCGFDTSPGSYGSVSASTFAACIAACDAAYATQGCVVVTYVGTACYMKTSFSTVITSSNAYSAVLYVAPPPYPIPVTNYVNASTGCGTALGSGIIAGSTSTFVNITAPDGNVRSYYIRIPALYNINKASPLIMAFHGRGDNGQNMEGDSGFSIDKWNPYGIAVYPNGINAEWQSDPDVYTGTSTGTVHINDISFVTALVANLSSQYCIDTGRIFMAGFSNGGGFVGVAACDPVLSTTFAAFGAHSGAFYTNTTDSNCGGTIPYTVFDNNLVQIVCTPGRVNVPIMEVHGDADGTIGYFGGGRRGFCLPAMPHWTTDWAVRNAQSSTNITTILNGGNVTKYEWGAATGGQGLVTHYRIANWGHEWSQIAFGSVIDMTPLMVDFFYRFSNPNGSTYDYLTTSVSTATSNTVSASGAAGSFTTTTTTSTYSTVTTVTSTTTTTTSTPSSSCSSTSTATTSATSAAAYSCPANNGQSILDINGAAYTLGCGNDTTHGATSHPQAPSSFNDCFALCDNTNFCDGFTYVGGAYGIGGGTCYLKSGFTTIAFNPGATNYVAAIRATPAPYSTVSTTTTSTTTTSTSSSSSSSSSSVTVGTTSFSASSSYSSMTSVLITTTTVSPTTCPAVVTLTVTASRSSTTTSSSTSTLSSTATPSSSTTSSTGATSSSSTTSSSSNTFSPSTTSSSTTLSSSTASSSLAASSSSTTASSSIATPSSTTTSSSTATTSSTATPSANTTSCPAVVTITACPTGMTSSIGGVGCTSTSP